MGLIVKICGLMLAEDASFAIESGADFVGIVVEPTSPRCLTTQGLGQILKQIEHQQKVVAVLGNNIDPANPKLVCQYQAFSRVEHAQSTWWPVVRSVPGKDPTNAAAPFRSDQIVVLDSFSTQGLGGTGHRVPLDWAKEFVDHCQARVLLAGGLNPGNVAEALRYTGAAGADVASGVETAPGQKGREAIRRFIEEAKSVR